MSDLELKGGVLHVRFGFRVAATPKSVFGRISTFRGLSQVVDGLREVRVRRAKRGGGLAVRFRGKLMQDYDVRVRVWPRFRKGAGVVRWRVPALEEPNTGRLHVDAAPGGSVVTVETALRMASTLPAFLLKLAVKTAIAAAGAAFRGVLAK